MTGFAGKPEGLIDQRSDPTFGASTDILELIHELKIHQTELEIQNEELKRAQLELIDLYRQFEDLYEFAPCGYLNLDPKGLVSRINLAGVILLNGLREKILHTVSAGSLPRTGKMPTLTP